MDTLIAAANPKEQAILQRRKGRYALAFPAIEHTLSAEIALEALQEAAAGLIADWPIAERADLYNDLGAAFLMSRSGRRRETVDAAAASFKAAYKAWRSIGAKRESAESLVNLGAAYAARISGSLAANLDISHACYAAALQTLEPGSSAWAKATMNLGAVLRRRVKGSRDASLTAAAAHLEQAEAAFERLGDMDHRIRCLIQLGAAYAERTRGVRAQSCEQAIRVFKQILRMLPKEGRPHETAQALHNLGCAYCDRLEGDPGMNLDRAIISLRAARRLRAAVIANPLQISQSTNALGTAWFERRRGARAINLAHAAEALEDALETRLRLGLANDAMRSAHNLVLVHAERADWEKVWLIARRILFDADGAFAANRHPAEHRRLAQETTRLKDFGALALSRQGRDQEAFSFFLAGKSRLLRLWTGVERRGLFAEQDLSPLAQEEAAIFFLLPPKGHCARAFLRLGGSEEVEAIDLPGLNMTLLEGLLHEGDHPWMETYRGLAHRRFEPFQAAIDRAATALQKPLAPARGRLAQQRGVRRLRLTLSGALALLPTARALVEDPNIVVIHQIGAGASPPPDVFRQAGGAVLVADVDPKRPLPSARAEADAIEKKLPQGTVVRLDERTGDKQAAQDALERFPSPRFAHFSVHGSFNWGAPERSGLHLAHKEILTLEDIIRLKRAPPLIVLSACETAVTAYRDLPDEAYGLPLAFLAAGARGVVSALWPVRDDATSYLMRRFYDLYLDGRDPAEALWAAQMWLREATVETLNKAVRSQGAPPDDDNS